MGAEYVPVDSGSGQEKKLRQLEVLGLHEIDGPPGGREEVY